MGRAARKCDKLGTGSYTLQVSGQIAKSETIRFFLLKFLHTLWKWVFQNPYDEG